MEEGGHAVTWTETGPRRTSSRQGTHTGGLVDNVGCSATHQVAHWRCRKLAVLEGLKLWPQDQMSVHDREKRLISWLGGWFRKLNCAQ